MPAMTSSQCAAAMLCFAVVECNVLPIICAAMRHFFGIAGVAADNVTNSSAARPAQHPIILRQYSAGDAFSQCLSTHAVDAFFQQCSATELTGSEEDLLNSLCHVAEMVQAVLPRSVSLQEWADRRVPRGFERQVNSSGLVYVGGRYLQYAPLLHNEPRSVSSAAQLASESTTAQSAHAVEEQVADGVEAFFQHCSVEAFFQHCSASELTGPEVELLNSLFRVAEVVQAVLPRSVSVHEWANRRTSRGSERQVNRFLQYVPLPPNVPRSAGSAAQPACDSSTAARLVVFDSTPAEPASAVEEDLSASSHSNATGESAVSQEAAYSYTMCLECGWAITTRPRDVWWTTLLVPESLMSPRPMCCPECLVEYCSAIYCPHAAMENGLQYRMWAQLSTAWKLITNVSAMPMKVLLLIVRSVGAHNLDTIWTCSECRPHWYNWYCGVCRMDNRFLHWSPGSHYGYCGASCDCCRSANRQIFPCEFCENLRNLKGTCRIMQDLVKRYDGI